MNQSRSSTSASSSEAPHASRSSRTSSVTSGPSSSSRRNAKAGSYLRITYTGSSSFLSSAICPHAIASIEAQMPLRNLHWRPSSVLSTALQPPGTPAALNNPIRTIQTLPVQFEALGSTNDAGESSSAASRSAASPSLFSEPLLHLYFVTPADAEQYRSYTRQDIRAWLAAIQNGEKGVAGTAASPANARSSIPLPGSRPGTPTGTGMSRNSSSSSGLVAPPPTQLEYLIVLVTPPLDAAAAASLSASPSSAAKPGPVSRFYAKHGASTASPAASSALNAAPATSDSSAQSMLEKMRSDFSESSSGSSTKGTSTAKRDRVVHIARLPPMSSAAAPHMSDPTLLAPLVTSLRECATAAFTTSVSALEDDIARVEEQRANASPTTDPLDLQTWATWWDGQERLASTFEAAGLPDDALARYTELDRALCLSPSRRDGVPPTDDRGRTLLALPPLGPLPHGADSTPLLDPHTHTFGLPPSQLLATSPAHAHLFALRCYLFARRAALLGALGRVGELMRETPRFLEMAGGLLRSPAGRSLPAYFTESWTFSSALDVSEQCQAWLIARGDIMDSHDGSDDGTNSSFGGLPSLSPAFHASKAELLDLARRQLDSIGMAVGHLPRSPPFSLSSGGGLDGNAQSGVNKASAERDLPAPPVLPENGTSDPKSAPATSITRDELLRVIESREVFDLHYVSLAERVLAGWMKGGRRRNVLRLRAVLGSLDFHRERYAEASITFAALADSYEDMRWETIETYLLVRQLECSARLDRPRDRAWVSTVVKLLRAIHGRSSMAITPGKVPVPHRPSTSDEDGAMSAKEWAEDDEQRWADAVYLFQALRDASTTFERELPVSGYQGLRIEPLQSTAFLLPDEDGSVLPVRVHAPDALNVDDVRICLTSKRREQLWLTSGPVHLKAGANDLDLVCASPAAGTYILDVSQVRIARVIFQTVAGRELPMTMPTAQQEATLITIPVDGDALRTSVGVPRHVRLDQQRGIEVEIHAGRNDVERAELSIALNSTRQVLSGLSEATISYTGEDSGSAPSLEVLEGGNGLSLGALKPDSTARLVIPQYEQPIGSSTQLPLVVSLDYWTSTGRRAHARRSLRTQHDLNVGLPFGVNVHDLFRHGAILSKFTVSAAKAEPVRFLPAVLRKDDEDVDGESSGAGKDIRVISPAEGAKSSVVTPRETATYVFRLEPNAQKPNSGAAPARLRVTFTYRTLVEEARERLRMMFADVVPSADITLQLRHTIEREMCNLVDEKMAMGAYTTTGSIRLGRASELSRWAVTCCERAGFVRHSATTKAAQRFVQDVASQARANGPLDWERVVESPGNAVWRTVAIPVDMPQVDLVAAISVQPLPPQPDGVFISGRAIKARVTVDVSFEWGRWAEGGSSEEDGLAVEETVRLGYDVAADLETWLVSGPKRGTFEVALPRGRETAQEGASASFEVVLLPLQHGELPLPPILLRPLEPELHVTPTSRAHPTQMDSTSSQKRQMPLPTCEAYVRNAAQRITVLPRRSAARATFSVHLGMEAEGVRG